MLLRTLQCPTIYTYFFILYKTKSKTESFLMSKAVFFTTKRFIEKILTKPTPFTYCWPRHELKSFFLCGIVQLSPEWQNWCKNTSLGYLLFSITTIIVICVSSPMKIFILINKRVSPIILEIWNSLKCLFKKSVLIK